MKKQDVYRLLEEKMLGYDDYAAMPLRATDEQFVPILPGANLTGHQIDKAMCAYTGEQVYVRGEVLKRLKQSAQLLASYDKDLQLEVVYGYRALTVQQELFERYKAELSASYSGKELLAAGTA